MQRIEKFIARVAHNAFVPVLRQYHHHALLMFGHDTRFAVFHFDKQPVPLSGRVRKEQIRHTGHNPFRFQFRRNCIIAFAAVRNGNQQITQSRIQPAKFIHA